MTDETVFVVDDDEAVRDAVILLLSSVGITAEGFADAATFLAQVDLQRPGCIVLDVRMPGMSGLELQQRLNESHCALPIIFMTGHGDVPMAVEAIKSGADEFLQKPFRDQDLLDRVNHALTHNTERRVVRSGEEQLAIGLARLTARERDVYDRLIDGSTTKQIAFDLDLSPRTVEIHRSRVMEKLQVRSIAGLLKLALGA